MKKNIVLLLGSCLIVVIIAEFALRLSKIAWEPQYDNRVKITQKSKNSIIGYELIPNFEGKAIGGYVSINSFGLRGPEVSMKKQNGVTRIAVLGDSWAFGWGVDQNEVFTSLLEKKLNQFSKKGKFEVINFSLFGYNLQQEEEILREKVISFEPDIVIFAFNINDLQGLKLKPLEDFRRGEERSSKNKNNHGKNNYLKELTYNAFHFIEETGNEHSHLFRLLDTTLRGLAIRLHFEKPGKEYYFKQFYEDGTQEITFLQDAFSRISEIAHERNFKVCIVYCPWMNELAQDNPYKEVFEKIKNEAEKRDLMTLNLFPFYKGQDVHKLRISNIDGHPTALGHKIAADGISDFILYNF
jgi:hypothetical protein